MDTRKRIYEAFVQLSGRSETGYVTMKAVEDYLGLPRYPSIWNTVRWLMSRKLLLGSPSGKRIGYVPQRHDFCWVHGCRKLHGICAKCEDEKN